MILVDLKIYKDIAKIIEYMKNDYEYLIDKKVNINIKTGLFDGTAQDISTNGYNSHIKSINKNNK